MFSDELDISKVSGACYGRRVRSLPVICVLSFVACGTRAPAGTEPVTSDAGADVGTGDGADARFSLCGDGVVGPGEECDDGAANSDAAPNACRSSCALPRCGDGVVDRGEACDGSPGCDALCDVPPRCGDGRIDEGEECDDGGTEDGDGCAATCTVEPSCGDGAIDAGEECDDGGTADGDGCSADCRVESGCGDGRLDPGEECDDGNLLDFDECNADCTLPVCGNGVVEGLEECDDGGDDCTDACRIAACGDGLVQADEECDDGELNGERGSRCHVDCTRALCGDGVEDPSEACDDGDPLSPDCFFCGFRASRASAVNLLVDGRELSMLQPDWFSAPIVGPIGAPGAAVGSPVASSSRSIDLEIGGDVVLVGVETEFAMGPSDHYSFIVYGDAVEPEVLVIREDESLPPDGGVRFRALNLMDESVGRITIADADREFASEVFVFAASRGGGSRDATRPPGPLTVEVIPREDPYLRWRFHVGILEAGADHAIYVGGTIESPFVLRTSTDGEVFHGERLPE